MGAQLVSTPPRATDRARARFWANLYNQTLVDAHCKAAWGVELGPAIRGQHRFPTPRKYLAHFKNKTHILWENTVCAFRLKKKNIHHPDSALFVLFVRIKSCVSLTCPRSAIGPGVEPRVAWIKHEYGGRALLQVPSPATASRVYARHTRLLFREFQGACSGAHCPRTPGTRPHPNALRARFRATVTSSFRRGASTAGVAAAWPPTTPRQGCTPSSSRKAARHGPTVDFEMEV